MNNKLFSAAICAMLGLWFQLPLQAQLIASGSFEYWQILQSTALNKGKRWIDPWSGDVRVAPKGLSFQKLAVTGGNVQTLAQDTFISRRLAVQRRTANTRTWIAFLSNIPAKITDSNYTGVTAGVQLFNGNNEQLLLGLTGATSDYQLAPFADGLQDQHIQDTASSPVVKPPANVPTPEEAIPFFAAVEKGEVGKVRLMLSENRGYAFSEKQITAKQPEYWQTPLFIATQRNDELGLAIMKLLLEAGADTNATRSADTFLIKGRYTPLSYTSDPIRIRLLIEHGANPNVPLYISGVGDTLLGRWLNDENMVKFLIAHGANIEGRDRNGNTALHNLIGGGSANVIARRVRLISLLIAKGANINVSNNDGETPLHLAVKLRPASRDFFGVWDGDPSSILQILLAKGADKEVRDKEGRTPIYDSFDNTQALLLLLTKGVRVNVRDNAGATPLHLAAEATKEKIAKILLSNGAEVNALDKDGNTPLQYAMRTKVGSHDMIVLLKAHGGKL